MEIIDFFIEMPAPGLPPQVLLRVYSAQMANGLKIKPILHDAISMEPLPNQILAGELMAAAFNERSNL